MSQLNVGNITAGRIVATGLITTTGNGLELPTYDQYTLPNSAESGVTVFNSNTQAINLKSGSNWVNISGSTTPTWTNTTRPSGTQAVGTYGWNTEIDQLEVYSSSGWVATATSGGAGGQKGTSQANPATSAQDVIENWGSQSSPTDGLYWIDTANGDTVQVYCIFDKGVGWMVVGKFDSDASSTVAGNISTYRNRTISDVSGTEFSADHGDYVPGAVRYIGTDNISTWQNTRNIDWWEGVPDGRAWKNYWTNGRSSGMDRRRREGFTTRGSYDGRGRWANRDHVFYQMSDTNVSIEASDFTGPDSFYLDNADDAKFGADAYSSSTGQDESVMVQFGRDDGRRAFMDRFPDRDGNNTNRRDYSTAVYVLLH